MTKIKLQINVGVTCFVLVALIIAAQFLPILYKSLKDFAGIFVAIAAAYLAYCFQRRQTFLTSLRELWNKCVEAKSDLIDYTHQPKPDQENFGQAHRAISVAIDMMRAVYCNVGETETRIGSYPFESLHDMRKALRDLGFQNVTAVTQQQARGKILDAWNAFRWAFLREFSTPRPRHPITKPGVLDPRRSSSAPRAT
jgi:hypothetical protein